MAVESQGEMERTILSNRPPELVAHLTTAKRVSVDEFLKLARRWRMDCGKLHASDARPPRRARRFEYLLALEFGTSPRQSAGGRLHAHLLLWNVNKLSISSMKASWRALSGERVGPIIVSYDPRLPSVRYVLKTLHTDADLITFSPRVVLYMTRITRVSARPIEEQQ